MHKNVRGKGFEPSRDCSHMLLRHACLPIPPPSRNALNNERTMASYQGASCNSIGFCLCSRVDNVFLYLIVRFIKDAQIAVIVVKHSTAIGTCRFLSYELPTVRANFRAIEFDFVQVRHIFSIFSRRLLCAFPSFP